MSRLRFGINLLSPSDRVTWQERCRRAEDLGYDVISVADHLGMPAPFPALVAAAAVTTRPRLSVFVLNTAFYGPALLARDLATTDQLTDGRLDAALGAGYVKDEFDAADLRWEPPASASTISSGRRSRYAGSSPIPSTSCGPGKPACR